MLQKGYTNNPNGRPKGTQNKNLAPIRENFSMLLSNNMERLQLDLNELTPRDRVRAILDLARFVVPTLKSIELDATIETTQSFKPIIINFGDTETDFSDYQIQSDEYTD
jgi:hypothetical protein